MHTLVRILLVHGWNPRCERRKRTCRFRTRRGEKNITSNLVGGGAFTSIMH